MLFYQNYTQKRKKELFKISRYLSKTKLQKRTQKT